MSGKKFELTGKTVVIENEEFKEFRTLEDFGPMKANEIGWFVVAEDRESGGTAGGEWDLGERVARTDCTD